MHDPDDDLESGPDGENPFEGFPLAFEPIPKILHSSYADDPFDTCVECEKPLLDPPTAYLIQKVRRDGEVVFEFAICMTCSQRTDSSMSEETRQNLEAYFAENTLETLGLDRCNLCGGEQRDETVLVGMGVGERLVGGGHMFCSECTESLEALLSESTQRQMDEFTERNFPGVPEHLGLPTSLLGL